MKKLHLGWIIWFVLIIVSLLPLLDLLRVGLPISHDGKDHVARIANFINRFQRGLSFHGGLVILIGDTGILF